MKTFLVSFLMLILSASIFPQVSSEFTKQNFVESNGLFKVDLTFTADSLGNLVSKPFSVPKYDLSYTAEANPILFRYKTVSTFGLPKVTIFLQGIYTTSTDTASLDTIRYEVAAQTEVDSLGVLTMNAKYAPSYQIYIRNNGAGDINSGRLQLLFPIKQRNFR